MMRIVKTPFPYVGVGATLLQRQAHVGVGATLQQLAGWLAVPVCLHIKIQAWQNVPTWAVCLVDMTKQEQEEAMKLRMDSAKGRSNEKGLKIIYGAIPPELDRFFYTNISSTWEKQLRKAKETKWK
ncbi:hypothetical protein V6N12_048656 [Hibiscus sabdariffa]|uniref:Uncharacterized protein n=1 Tax=Hibiscus sabdariffa TaxID=183260 RepID=A0ABR2EHX2_9ROSI